MDPEAKAIVIQEAIKAATKPVQDFIAKVSGRPGKELGEWFADVIRGQRFQTQLKIFIRAQQLLADAGINPGSVNLRILVPLLEKASLEESDDLVENWARLLANASSPVSGVRSAYVQILSELEPVEARIMQFIYAEILKNVGENYVPTNPFAANIDGNVVRGNFGLDHATFEQAIDNLYRLRLLSPTATRLDFIDTKDVPFARYTKDTLGVTYLGYFFAKACNDIPKQLNTREST